MNATQAQAKDLKVGDVFDFAGAREVTHVNPLGPSLIAIDALAFPDDGQRYEFMFQATDKVFITTDAAAKGN